MEELGGRLKKEKEAGLLEEAKEVSTRAMEKFKAAKVVYEVNTTTYYD